MRTESISYQVDGIEAVGFLAVPDGDGPRPGVLVCHEGPGQDDHARSRATRIAEELGYVAFVLDYQGGGKPVADLGVAFARLGELMAEPARTRALGQAGLDLLLGAPEVDADRVAVIGYCFGGTMALELARTGANLKAVVGFHSGLAVGHPDDVGSIKGRVLVCLGDTDPLIPTEQRHQFESEMLGSGVDWQMHVYGGVGHSFTNPAADSFGMPGVAFDADADRRSWNSMLELFAETL